MNRRDTNPASRQSGGYRDENSGWESPRQANQWQDDASRQTGGGSSGGWGDTEGSSYRDDAPRRSSRQEESEARFRGGERGNQRYRETGGYGDQSRGQTYSDDRYRDDRQARSAQAYRFSGERDVYPIREYDASGGNDFSNFTSEDYGGRDFYARRGGGGGGMSPSFSYRPTFDTFGRGYYRSRDDRPDNGRGHRDYGDWREYGEERGFLRRAGDEIASWFGDEDAARRREQDHRGRGPSDYTRSDERIREDVNDRLTQDWRVDATNIRVLAKDGEVTLDGTVGSRHAKRRAEDLAEDVSGVKHVQNNLRVVGATDTGQGGTTGFAARSSTAGSSAVDGTSTSPTTGSTPGSSS